MTGLKWMMVKTILVTTMIMLLTTFGLKRTIAAHPINVDSGHRGRGYIEPIPRGTGDA
jgi:hypothetical protein